MPISERWRRRVIPIADKIVFASSAYVELKSTINQMSDQLIDLSKPSGGPADDRLRQATALIRPLTGDNLSLVRVGGNHDGGYVMADPLEAFGAVSIGIGPDVSWDQDVSSRGIPVAMFDPTIRRLPAKVENSVFHRIGISPATSHGYAPLSELIEIAGFSSTDNLLLKIDVEGAEWPTFAALSPMSLGQFTQITVELHGLSELRDAEIAPQMLQALSVLTTSHLPIHVHANNYDSLIRFDDYWFANTIEVTLIRGDVLSNVRPAVDMAGFLDRPCDPRVEEISLAGLLHIQSSLLPRHS